MRGDDGVFLGEGYGYGNAIGMGKGMVREGWI